MKLLPFLAFATVSTVLAQSSKPEIYSTSIMEQKESAALRGIDRSTGLSQEILHRYPNHFTMFIVREKDGQSELHATTADVFFVVDGQAELWTGGEMQSAQVTAPGEQRGVSLSGKDHVALHKGDIVHIPAGMPHQVRVKPGDRFAYFVVKVDETKP